MAICERVLRLFAQHQVEYDLMPHREAFTSQHVAQAAGVAGRLLAKVVVLRGTTGGPLMAVLPACQNLDFEVMGRVTGRPGLALIDEHELQRLFPDCEVGAMPPFGALYGMPLYLDACFYGQRHFHFQSGNHREVVRMRFEDYVRVAHPTVGDLCLHERAAEVKPVS